MNQRDVEYDTLYNEAYAAGLAADCIPTPMIVQQRANPFDDSSPVIKEWYVSAGMCGFAWVTVRPATSSFARWLKRVKGWETDRYAGGMLFWVSAFGQSYERKLAFAQAFAAALRERGVNARANGRLD